MARILASIGPAAAGHALMVGRTLPSADPAAGLRDGRHLLLPDERDSTAAPDVAAAGDDAGLTQRELLMELREDIKGLRAAVDAIARDQALGVEEPDSAARANAARGMAGGNA